MFFKKTARPITLAFSAMMVAGLMPIFAQEPKSESPETQSAPKKTYDPSRRVPDYFGQIGLTPEQKEAIYKIRAKHNEKIDALKKQIVDAQAAMLAECEAQLTEAQKKQLEFRRANAPKAKKSQGAPAEVPAKPAGKDSDR